MSIRHGKAARLYVHRHRWMAENIHRFAMLPGVHDDVTDEKRLVLDAVLREMRTQQLFFGRSNPTAQRSAIRTLVSELRGEPIPNAWW